MEFQIKMYDKNLVYIPKQLRQILGTSIRAVPNRAAVLLFSNKTTLDDALTSLDIIKADLLHAKTLQQTVCQGKLRQEIAPIAAHPR